MPVVTDAADVGLPWLCSPRTAGGEEDIWFAGDRRRQPRGVHTETFDCTQGPTYGPESCWGASLGLVYHLAVSLYDCVCRLDPQTLKPSACNKLHLQDAEWREQGFFRVKKYAVKCDNAVQRGQVLCQNLIGWKRLGAPCCLAGGRRVGLRPAVAGGCARQDGGAFV